MDGGMDFGGDVGGDFGGDFGGDYGGDFGGDWGGDYAGDYGGDWGGDYGGDYYGDTGWGYGDDLGSGYVPENFSSDWETSYEDYEAFSGDISLEDTTYDDVDYADQFSSEPFAQTDVVSMSDTDSIEDDPSVDYSEEFILPDGDFSIEDTSSDLILDDASATGFVMEEMENSNPSNDGSENYFEQPAVSSLDIDETVEEYEVPADVFDTDAMFEDSLDTEESVQDELGQLEVESEYATGFEVPDEFVLDSGTETLDSSIDIEDISSKNDFEDDISQSLEEIDTAGKLTEDVDIETAVSADVEKAQLDSQGIGNDEIGSVKPTTDELGMNGADNQVCSNTSTEEGAYIEDESSNNQDSGDMLVNAQEALGEAIEIEDWDDYPSDIPKPEGPIKIISGDEYNAARDEADKANNKLHKDNPELDGLEIHEILPVKFGGSPTDPNNKIALTPEKHDEVHRFWSKYQK